MHKFTFEKPKKLLWYLDAKIDQTLKYCRSSAKLKTSLIMQKKNFLNYKKKLCQR